MTSSKDRMELKCLMVELGDYDSDYANFVVNRLKDQEVEKLLFVRRTRRAIQLEAEALVSENRVVEPVERDLSEDLKSVVGHTTGGGRRVIRKGSEMGG